MFASDEQTRESWTLIGYTTAASIIGTMVIFSDLIWNKFTRNRLHFSIVHSSVFLGTALSLSGGTLLITALDSLLPSATAYITDTGLSTRQVNVRVFAMFALGAALCLIMNTIVHRIASRSIVACIHEVPGFKPSETSPLLHEHACPDPQHVHTNADPHPHHHGDHRQPDVHAVASNSHRRDVEANDSVSECSSVDHIHDIRHTTAQLLSIGLQTGLGVAVHRVPEGFLLFATSRADRTLGLSLVLSLAIHSFSEGFSIAVPIYGALGNRLTAAAIAVILGGGSQPLGALLAQKYVPENGLDHGSYGTFGMAIAATAGFMVTIAIQMLTAAVVYQGSQRSVIYVMLLGMLLVLGTRCL